MIEWGVREEQSTFLNLNIDHLPLLCSFHCVFDPRLAALPPASVISLLSLLLACEPFCLRAVDSKTSLKCIFFIHSCKSFPRCTLPILHVSRLLVSSLVLYLTNYCFHSLFSPLLQFHCCPSTSNRGNPSFLLS